MTKLRLANGPRKEFLYRCDSCGAEHWYVTELPDHLTKCMALYRGQCRGTERLIETRTVPYRDGERVDHNGDDETCACIEHVTWREARANR